MNAIDYIAIAIVALIVGAAVLYIIRAKRRGEKCVGCPYARECCGRCGGTCGSAEKNEIDEKK